MSVVTKKSFSVILPCHNEESYLLYSLPSIFDLNPTEVLILLDHCTDATAHVAKTLAFKYQMSTRLTLVNVDEFSDFRMRFAYLRWIGCKLCTYDTVLVTGADLILDPKIRDYLCSLNDSVKMINFGYQDFPINWRNLLKRLMTKLMRRVGSERWLSGVHVFSKQAMLEMEDLDDLKRIEAAQDTHLHKAIQRKYETVYILTATLHLRPKESGDRHYLRGKLYWNVAHRGFLITLLSAVSMFRLNLIKGYIHERFGAAKNE